MYNICYFINFQTNGAKVIEFEMIFYRRKLIFKIFILKFLLLKINLKFFNFDFYHWKFIFKYLILIFIIEN